MKKGKVKFFNESKGFGFIIEETSGEDYFVHASDLIDTDTINTDEEVTFEIEETNRGFKATNVKLV